MKIFLLLIFWSLWFHNFSSRTVISPLLPIIEDEFAISHALAGSLFLFASVGHTITVFLAGLLSLRIGYKRCIISGFIILVVALLCLKYAKTYSSFTAIAFFMGLGSGIYSPCAIPLITSIFRRGNWGKAIAFHETAASFSILSIPLLTALALRFFHWRTLFVILSGTCLMVIISFWVFAPNLRPQVEKRTRFSSMLRRRDFWIMAILCVFAAMATGGIYNITLLFLVKEKGMQLEMANTIFGFSRVGGLFVTILIGFVLDRYTAKKILLITLLTTGLSTIGLAVAQTFWLLVTMLVMQGSAGVAFFPVAIMAISKLTNLNERSIFIGTIMGIAMIVGLGFTPVVLGAVADAWNFQIGILVLGVFTTVSCVFLKGFQEI